MQRKIYTLRQLMDSGDWHAAIRSAAKFPRLGKDRDAILRAKDALNNPDFYRQIGKQPDELIREGAVCLVVRHLQCGLSKNR